MPTNEIIRFQDVNYYRNQNPILQNVSFQIQEGDSVAIVGRNGAGKTTLINLLYGYIWPTSGTIFVLGEEYGTTAIKPIQDQIGILQNSHQEQLLQRNLTALEVVITGIHNTIGLYREVTNEQIKRAEDKLTSLGLLLKKDQLYTSLSSGEKTKILLLRALGENKKILILDEPTATLDLTARYDFEKSLSVLKSQNQNLTRILITHRIEEIPENFNKVILIKEGKLLASGNKMDVLTEIHLSDLYDLNLSVTFSKNRAIVYYDI